jgi:hypothetical protein
MAPCMSYPFIYLFYKNVLTIRNVIDIQCNIKFLWESNEEGDFPNLKQKFKNQFPTQFILLKLPNTTSGHWKTYLLGALPALLSIQEPI